MVVSLYESELEGVFFFLGLGSRLRKGGDEIVLDSFEAFCALLLRLGSLSEGIAFIVAEVVNCGLEGLVLDVVWIISLVYVGAELVHKFLLNAAVFLYLLVSELDGIEHSLLTYLVHLTFNHHNVLLGSGYHKLELSSLHIGEAGVDDELVVYETYSHLSYRASKWQV